MEQKDSTRWGTIAAYITLISVIYFVAVIVLLHVLRTENDPAYRFLSEYVVGPYGELMRSTFFALSAGTLALVFGLWRSVASVPRFVPGLVLLVIWAVAVFLAGMYTADLQGSPPTASGEMHARMAMIGFPCVALALPLISILIRWDPRWNSVWIICIGLSAAMIVCFFAIGKLAEMQLAGIGQRLFLACLLAWMFVVGRKLLMLQKQ